MNGWRSLVASMLVSGAMLALPARAADAPAGQVAAAPRDDFVGSDIVDMVDIKMKVRLPCADKEYSASRRRPGVLYCVKPNYTAQIIRMDTSAANFDQLLAASDKETDALGGSHRALALQGRRAAVSHMVKDGVEYFSQVIEISPTLTILLGLMSKDVGNRHNAEVAQKIFDSAEFSGK